jgi:hypothetical protein
MVSEGKVKVQLEKIEIKNIKLRNVFIISMKFKKNEYRNVSSNSFLSLTFYFKQSKTFPKKLYKSMIHKILNSTLI